MKSKKPKSSIDANRILHIRAMIIGWDTLVVILHQTNLLSQQTELIHREQQVSVNLNLKFEIVRPTDS
ncbi:hypothetical protein [Echinicola sp. 20G]|uniref:hypothetical protein n=1 Tax=Echinicola sp. 20G TaxID=2781961 RepID=UPI00190FEEE7|nr:hypothetical protein [Echinicola sp. 20G]